ncbi:MAG: hypothetical protein IJG41_00365 [Bacteroidales bacterium]|nr:hypothetical protein [Bacteroidales bacterium]
MNCLIWLLSVILMPLSAIDTLMQSQPDSALTLLLDEPTDEPYYQLLLSEALYKNDYAQTNRDELLVAMAYFDSVNDPFLAARCHYMNGVGYYEMDSVVPACEEYMKAIQIMEEHYSEKELVGLKAKYMALAYTKLTKLFSDQYLHEQAIYFGKQALHYYHKYDAEPWHIAWILNRIGVHYEMMEQWDSANCYFNDALDVMPDSNSLMYRDIATEQAFLLYQTKMDTINTLNKLKWLFNQSESEKECFSRSAVIGTVYFHEGLYDSAWSYLCPVFYESSIIELKKQSVMWLIEICKSQNKTQDLLVFNSFLAPFANQSEISSTLKSQLTGVYNVFRHDKIEKTQQQKQKEQLEVVIFVFSCLFLMIVAGVFLFKKNKVVHRMQQAALSGRLKRSNEALRSCLETIKKKENELKAANKTVVSEKSTQEKYNYFLHSEICQQILDLVAELNADQLRPIKTNVNVSEYKTFALSSTQQALFLKTLGLCFPELLDSLKKLHPALNRKDIFYCGLLLLDVDKMSICILLQESYYTCRRTALKLEKGLGCQQSLNDFLFERIGLS